MSTRKVFLKYRLPAILWAVLIFIASSIPSKALPHLGLFSWDKLLHTGEFGIFGLLLARAFNSWLSIEKIRTLVALTVSTGVIWALLDEVHQMFVLGRNANVYDFLADALGVIIAQVIFIQVQQRRLRST